MKHFRTFQPVTILCGKYLFKYRVTSFEGMLKAVDLQMQLYFFVILSLFLLQGDKNNGFNALWVNFKQEQDSTKEFTEFLKER